MIGVFAIDHKKSDTVSKRLTRLARLLQLESPDVVIRQEIEALKRELHHSDVVTVSAIVESRKG